MDLWIIGILFTIGCIAKEASLNQKKELPNWIFLLLILGSFLFWPFMLGFAYMGDKFESYDQDDIVTEA